MNNMDALMSYVRTTEERDILFRELGELLNTFYKTDETEFQKMLNTQVSLRTAELIHTVLHDQDVDVENRENVKSLLEQLKDEVNRLSEIEVTLAIKPQHDFLTQLSSWINQNMQDKTILHLVIKPEILGGLIILYKGKYIDLSLNRKITELFTTKKDEIFPILS